MMYLLGHGPFLLCKLHLKGLWGCVTAVSTGSTMREHSVVCCWSCCASWERINVSAVATAPWVFFQLPCSHLAYPGFSGQCALWDSARQQLSPWAATTEPACPDTPEPVPHERSHLRGKPGRHRELPQLNATREKRSQQGRPSTAKNK